MRAMFRGLVGLLALVNAGVGVGFLIAPARLAAAFYLVPAGSQGMATLRADFPGFFVGAAIFALLAAVRGQSAPLHVPLALLALALTGRGVSLIVDGVGAHALAPMIAEAVMLALLGIAYRVFDRPSS